MTRQNRVMPDGSIVAVAARGTLTGNRGVLHDADGRLGAARWRHPHWISCTLDYKGWRRQIMAPGRWTELFFLDEAVAMAAGHRPCALCRRGDFLAFRAAWGRAFGAEIGAAAMDRQLHAARVGARGRAQITHEGRLSALPDGTFVRVGAQCQLVTADHLRPFTPDGYGPALRQDHDDVVTVLTPRPMVALLAAGYRPRLHPTART